MPCSSTRLQKATAHLKLLERVHAIDAPIAFEGRLLRPGGFIDSAELPERAVILECAGAVGDGRGHNRRECLWILWRFDWDAFEWRELGRAASVSRDWLAALHAPALRALSADRGPFDVLKYCGDACQEIARSIDDKLELEPPEIKLRILGLVYEQVAGRIAREL